MSVADDGSDPRAGLCPDRLQSLAVAALGGRDSRAGWDEFQWHPARWLCGSRAGLGLVLLRWTSSSSWLGYISKVKPLYH